MFRKILLVLLIFTLTATAFYFYLNQPHQSENELILYGNVDVRQVNLSFRVSGLVKEIYYEEGDFVPANSLVGILDKQPYLDQVKQAAAALESIKASLNNAETLLKRRSELISDGSISQEDFDNARTNTMTLTAEIKSAEAALSVAHTNLSFTEAYAPTDGIILSRIREPGTVVNPSQPIYSLSVITPVWVRAYVPEKLLGVVYPGMEAEIYTDTAGGTIYKGHIGFISPVAEFTPKTVETTQLRTDLVYRLRVYADNPDKGLRQGMPVTIKLLKTPPPLPISETTQENE